MTARLTMLLAAMLAIGVLAVGCGGDEGAGAGENDETSSTVGSSSSEANASDETEATEGEKGEIGTSSLSKAAFIKKANAICNSGGREALSYEPPANTQMTEGEIAQRAALTWGPAFQRVADEIYELGAPSGEEAQVQAFVDALQHGVDAINANQDSLASYAELEKPLKQASALSRKIGFEACWYVE